MNSTAPPASAPSSAAASLLREYSEKGKLTDLATVLEFLKNPSDKIKILATQTASGIIKENLLVNFKKMDVPVRKKLVQLLESLHPRVIDDISQDLFNESPQRRLDTVQLLGLLKKNPRIRDILATLVKDRDVKIRATACAPSRSCYRPE